MKLPRDVCLAERQSTHIRRLRSGCDAKQPEMSCATFWDFMLCEVKRAVLRECWLHIHFPFWFSLI
jgi:hypothetical protein